MADLAAADLGWPWACCGLSDKPPRQQAAYQRATPFHSQASPHAHSGRVQRGGRLMTGKPSSTMLPVLLAPCGGQQGEGEN